MTTDQSLPGPFKGLRVIELADRTGQWCGKLMADFGADVVKVEPPGGVAERRVGPFYQDVEHPDRSLYFWHYNTSKRSVTLDLEQEAGRELFRRLPAEVHFFFSEVVRLTRIYTSLDDLEHYQTTRLALPLRRKIGI